MKKLLPVLLALALLTGCGQGEYTLETTIRVPTGDDAPVTSPAQPISAPAVVKEGREPTEDFDLPAEIVDIREWGERSSRRDDMPVGKLIELPEKDVALYAVRVYPAGGSVAWLRWGDALAEFDWTFGGPHMVMPDLQCFDVDNDGQEEVVAVTCGGTGTGVSIDVLHIVEENEEGILTDYIFPEELWGERMRSLLPAEVKGLGTGAIAGFDLETCRDGCGDIRFCGSACLDADGYNDCYVADLTASVTYEDGIFTLSDFHLDSFT